MKEIKTMILGILLVLATTGAEAKKKVQEFSRPVTIQRQDRLCPAEFGSIRIEGYLGHKLELCLENRVKAQHVDHFIKPFAIRDEQPWGWRGEFWGKWYTSAMLGYGYHPTEEYRELITRAVDELIATQTPDGYIGTSKAPVRIAGDWDIWGRKYVLLGLIANYDQTGSRKVLDAAIKAADCLIAEVGPNSGNNIAETGWVGWKGEASCSVLEPIVLLYQRTGEQRFLDFANYIVSSWDTPNTLSPTGLKLIQGVISGMPMWKLGGAPKAYEMTSCFEGVCELYRSTGNPYYLDACKKLADNVLRDEITIIGSGSMAEIWCNTKLRQTEPMNHGMETCATATWMKFLYQMLRITGESRYADAMETALYNALLAAMTPNGEWWSYFTGLMGERTGSHLQFQDMCSSCCVVNGPRALLLTPYWSIMGQKDGVVVNLYAPQHAKFKTPKAQAASIQMETEYPRTGNVKIRIDVPMEEIFTISLRIPEWSRTNSIKINGEPYDGYVIPGTYANVHRTWKPGDVLELTLDMRTRVELAPSGTGDKALVRGPIVFAFDSRLVEPQPSPKSKPMYRYEFMDSPDGYIDTEVVPSSNPDIWMTLNVPLKDEAGNLHYLPMCDFASAGNQWSEDNIFRTWIQQPFDVRHLYIKLHWSMNATGTKRPEIPQLYKK